MEPKTSAAICGMGHSMKRKEDPRFIRGQGRYVDDIKLPGMLHMDIVRSPYAHAKILAIHAEKALAIPGVLAVITGETLKAYNLHWMPTLMSDTQMVLPVEKVMYQAQEVAAVIATDRYIAADGVDAVEVEYEPLPVVVDPRKALEPGAPVLRTDKEGKTDNHIWHWETGDRAATDKAFAEADVTVKQDIYIPRIHVASIETCGCVADFNKTDTHLTVYMTTQAPHAIRTVFALVAGHVGLSEEKIRIISPDLGGGFGGKVPVYPGYVIAVAASVVIGKPVKWVEDRMENLQADSFARDYHMTAELAAKKDGTMTALRIKTLADHGYADAAANPSKFPAGLFSICTGSYDIKTAFTEMDAAYTNKPPGGVAYRCSFRVTEAVHAIERMTDVLAQELKMDPAEVRFKNFIPADKFPYKSALGWEYDSGNYKAALEKALDKIGYAELRKEQAEKRAKGELMGIGICTFTEIVGAGPSKDFDILGIKMFDSAEIRVHPTGKAIARFGTKSQGQGHETTYAQIVAEELGIPAAHIQVEEGDTDTAPYGLGTYASRSTPTSGAAAWAAARQIQAKAQATAGHRAQDPGEGEVDRGAPARVQRGRPRLGAGQVFHQGRARQGEDHPGMRLRGLHQHAAGHGARARGDALLRPAESHLPVRQLHLRRRHRPRHRRGEGAPLRGGRRLRQHHQSDDRRRADPRRPRAGRRTGAVRGDQLRRGRQHLRRQLPRLLRADGARMPELGDRQDDHAVTPSSVRRQGRRRVGHGRRAARDCQRGGGRALAPRRHARRHPDHAGKGLAAPEIERRGRVACLRPAFRPSTL